MLDRVSTYKLIGGVIVTALLVFFTFDLNKGLFSFHVYDSVVILFSSHGHALLFPFTAIVGSILILLLGKLTTNVKLLTYLGQNVLVIFCLNGVFYHFINDRLAKWMLDFLPKDSLVILLSGIIVTISSLALTIPFILLFNRYIPQLIGKPKIKGPIFKNLV